MSYNTVDGAMRERVLRQLKEVEQRYGLPVISIASLTDILALLENNPEFAQYKQAVLEYRSRYGI